MRAHNTSYWYQIKIYLLGKFNFIYSWVSTTYRRKIILIRWMNLLHILHKTHIMRGITRCINIRNGSTLLATPSHLISSQVNITPGGISICFSWKSSNNIFIYDQFLIRVMVGMQIGITSQWTSIIICILKMGFR